MLDWQAQPHRLPVPAHIHRNRVASSLTRSVGSRAKQSSAGLELTKLIVEAEGIPGVITKRRLKLMPTPPAKAIVLVADDIHELARKMGGTTTGEHGVGVPAGLNVDRG